MRDKLMEQVLADYDEFKKQEDSKPSYKKPKGPYCPRCAAKLTRTKNADGTGFYSCRRHGFVRNILN